MNTEYKALAQKLRECGHCKAECPTCEGRGRGLYEGWDRNCPTCGGSGYAPLAPGHKCESCDEDRRRMRAITGTTVCDECGHECAEDCTNCAGMKAGESVCSICRRNRP